MPDHLALRFSFTSKTIARICFLSFTDAKTKTHYSCICKRAKRREVPNYIKGKKITDVVFDTSRVRIYEAGEWKKEKYGGHRKWRKLHVAIDFATKEIVYSKLTSDSTHDLTLNRKKGNVLIDEIADQHELYKKCELHNKQPLTPLRKGANDNKGSEQRKEPIKVIKALEGDLETRAIWSKLTGYDQITQIEGLFSKWKRMLGETLRSKLESTTANEIYVKSLIYE